MKRLHKLTKPHKSYKNNPQASTWSMVNRSKSKRTMPTQVTISSGCAKPCSNVMSHGLLTILESHASSCPSSASTPTAGKLEHNRYEGTRTVVSKMPHLLHLSWLQQPGAGVRLSQIVQTVASRTIQRACSNSSYDS